MNYQVQNSASLRIYQTFDSLQRAESYACIISRSLPVPLSIKQQAGGMTVAIIENGHPIDVAAGDPPVTDAPVECTRVTESVDPVKRGRGRPRKYNDFC